MIHNPPPYSDEEDEIVRRMFAAEKSDTDIAAALRALGVYPRTVYSVRGHRRVLRLLRQEHIGATAAQPTPRTYWEQQADATERLAAALRKAGASEGTRRAPQTDHPRRIPAIDAGLGSANGFMFPASVGW